MYNPTNDVMADLENSAKIFDIVTPILEQHFSGKIYSTEGHNSKLETLLDKCCGIDAIVVKSDETAFGIAHRVKYKYYPDFAIRIYRPNCKTEIDHMRQSGIKPRYHVTTICIDDKPAVIAIAKSMDLVDAIDNGLYKIKHGEDGTKFAALNWNTLIENGINVDIIKL